MQLGRLGADRVGSRVRLFILSTAQQGPRNSRATPMGSAGPTSGLPVPTQHGTTMLAVPAGQGRAGLGLKKSCLGQAPLTTYDVFLN